MRVDSHSLIEYNQPHGSIWRVKDSFMFILYLFVCIACSVVECSRVTQAALVRFPADADIYEHRRWRKSKMDDLHSLVPTSSPCLYRLGCSKYVQLTLHCGCLEYYRYIEPVCNSQIIP